MKKMLHRFAYRQSHGRIFSFEVPFPRKPWLGSSWQKQNVSQNNLENNPRRDAGETSTEQPPGTCREHVGDPAREAFPNIFTNSSCCPCSALLQLFLRAFNIRPGVCPASLHQKHGHIEFCVGFFLISQKEFFFLYNKSVFCTWASVSLSNCSSGLKRAGNSTLLTWVLFILPPPPPFD